MATLYVQERSKDTRDRIASTFEAMLNRLPYASIGIKGITDEAGYSVGVFYRHFTDKHALLKHLWQAYANERSELRTTYLASENWKGLDAEATVRNLVRSTLTEYAQRAGLFRAIASVPELQTGDEGMDILYEGVQALLVPFLGHTPAPQRAAQFAFFLITSAGQAALVAQSRHAQFLGLSRPELEEELTEVVLSYIKP